MINYIVYSIIIILLVFVFVIAIKAIKIGIEAKKNLNKKLDYDKYQN